MTGPRFTTLEATIRAHQEAKIARENRVTEQHDIRRMLAVIVGGHTLHPYTEGIRP